MLKKYVLPALVAGSVANATAQNTQVSLLPAMKSEARHKWKVPLYENLAFGGITKAISEPTLDGGNDGKLKLRSASQLSFAERFRFDSGIESTLKMGQKVTIKGYLGFIQKYDHGKFECRFLLPIDQGDYAEMIVRVKHDLGDKARFDRLTRFSQERFRQRLDVVFDIKEFEDAMLQVLLRHEGELCISNTIPLQQALEKYDGSIQAGLRYRF